MIGIIHSRACDVVKYFLAIQAIPFCDGTLGVDVQTLPLSATILVGSCRRLHEGMTDEKALEKTNLASDGNCVANLRFSCSKLAEKPSY